MLSALMSSRLRVCLDDSLQSLSSYIFLYEKAETVFPEFVWQRYLVKKETIKKTQKTNQRVSRFVV